MAGWLCIASRNSLTDLGAGTHEANKNGISRMINFCMNFLLLKSLIENAAVRGVFLSDPLRRG
jgi:hypothetical protein